ncbi:MAG: hypothetical protein JXR68_01410 [Bacteroidales bacterium]|nr:hypothetical protein [Bacteroidales bacterium]
MKKINFLIFGVIAIILYSCNPNQSIYEELDATQVPYNETFTYELTPEDYETIADLALDIAVTAEDSAIAEGVASFKSFSEDRIAALLVPAFIEKTFIVLDSASAISIVYKYDDSYAFDDEHHLISTDTFSLGSTDFDTFIKDNIASAEIDEKVFVEYVGANYNSDTTYERAFAFFTFDGTNWQHPDNAYELTIDDYIAMGITAYYKNFSYSRVPEDYLPVFFELTFPYAKAGDQYEVFYEYYDGSNTFGVINTITFDGNEWLLFETNSDQFVHFGAELGWLFDPTVSYSLEPTDFQILVDWIAASSQLSGYLDLSYPANTEVYFGASAWYGNFDMRQSVRIGNDPLGYLTDLSEKEIDEVIFNRLVDGVLIIIETIFPNAQPFSNGVPVYYEITFDCYNGKHINYTIRYLCTGVGTFEYVEGPYVAE